MNLRRKMAVKELARRRMDFCFLIVRIEGNL